MIAPELAAAIVKLMRFDRVLIACDFDGTLAPLVDDPALSTMSTSAATSLRGLAAMQGVAVAIVSGRARHELFDRTGFVDPIHLVGSHGAEHDHDREPLPTARQLLLEQTAAALARVAADFPGAWVERKPVSVALHYRTVEPHLAGEIVGQAIQQIGDGPSIHLVSGSSVLEILLVDDHKGLAVERLRSSCAADAVVFIGDDRTDEHAFGVLRGHDVGVKVGIGPTAAEHRVDDVDDVGELLEVALRARPGRRIMQVGSP